MKIVEVRTTHLAKPIDNPVTDSTLLQTVRDIILVEIDEKKFLKSCE